MRTKADGKLPSLLSFRQTILGGIISGSAFRGIQTKTQASLLRAAAQTSSGLPTLSQYRTDCVQNPRLSWFDTSLSSQFYIPLLTFTLCSVKLSSLRQILCFDSIILLNIQHLIKLYFSEWMNEWVCLFSHVHSLKLVFSLLLSSDLSLH